MWNRGGEKKPCPGQREPEERERVSLASEAIGEPL